MEKLVEFIKLKGYSASRFAEMLGVKPAGISHILNGRNKPSYDLICRILQTFPEINPYWLLGNQEEMLNSSTPAAPNEPILPGVENVAQNLSPEPELPLSSPVGNHVENTNGRTDIQPRISTKPGAVVERIIVVYADKTFESFEPR